MPRRKILVFAALLVLAIQVLASGVIYSVYALAPPPPSIDVALHFDLDTAKGFENVTTLTAQDPSPVFVLMQGRTATMNVTFTAVKEPFADIKENDTASILSIWYGGNAANNYKGGGGYTSLPDGIIASIKPQNLTLPPGSKATVTLQISAAPNTAIRSYDLDFSVRIRTPSYTHGMTPAYNTILTIVEDSSSITTNSTKSTTTLCVNRTVTTTVTSIQTITVTSGATPNLSVTTGTPTTTTVSTTTAIFTERVAEPSIYAWAIGAAAVAAILAVVALRRRI